MLLCFNYGWHIGPRASLFLHIHVRLGKIVHKGILQIFIRTLYGQVILGQHLQGYAWSSRIFWGNMGAFVSMELWECCLKACQQNGSLICVVNKSSWVELTNSKTWEEDQNTREKEKPNSLKGEIQLWLDWIVGEFTSIAPFWHYTKSRNLTVVVMRTLRWVFLLLPWNDPWGPCGQQRINIFAVDMISNNWTLQQRQKKLAIKFLNVKIFWHMT